MSPKSRTVASKEDQRILSTFRTRRDADGIVCLPRTAQNIARVMNLFSPGRLLHDLLSSISRAGVERPQRSHNSFSDPFDPARCAIGSDPIRFSDLMEKDGTAPAHGAERADSK